MGPQYRVQNYSFGRKVISCPNLYFASSTRQTKSAIVPLEPPYHKTRAGNERGAWPTMSGSCQTPRRWEMKRRSLIDPLTLHPHLTLTPPSAMPPPVSRRTGRRARPQSLLVGMRDCSKGTAQNPVNLGASCLSTQSNSEICPVGDRNFFGEQTLLFHAPAYPCYTEWARLTALDYSPLIIGGKVAHNLLCYALLYHGALLFCCRCIKSSLLVNTEEVVSEGPFPFVF